MKLAKSSKEHVDMLREWMMFNDQLSKIDPTSKTQWYHFKKEMGENYLNISKKCEDSDGFNIEKYFDYYSENISAIHGRIIFGYETLVENACDPNLNYLDYNAEIKNALSLVEKINSEKYENYLETTNGLTIEDFEVNKNGVFSHAYSNEKSSHYGVIKGTISSLTFRSYTKEEFFEKIESDTEFSEFWQS